VVVGPTLRVRTLVCVALLVANLGCARQTYFRSCEHVLNSSYKQVPQSTNACKQQLRTTKNTHLVKPPSS